MTVVSFREEMIGLGHDAVFIYNGKKSGVESEVRNSIFTFEVWYGRQVKCYTDFDQMLYDPFFDGKSLSELLKEVTFTFL